jgi:hypothetical protein
MFGQAQVDHQQGYGDGEDAVDQRSMRCLLICGWPSWFSSVMAILAVCVVGRRWR